MDIYKVRFEKLYSEFNKRDFVSPDPLQFLYDYPDVKDREIAGLIAASLAFGNIKQILKSVNTVLEKTQKSPYGFITNYSRKDFHSIFQNFKYRFVGGDDIAEFFLGIKSVINEFGSLENCFLSGYSHEDRNMLGAIEFTVKKILPAPHKSYLLTLPSRGSACKRLNLYLRWMIRKDEVDPGGWGNLSPSKLLIPLDTHMWKACKGLKFTKRNQADLKSALEITEAFKKICPEDPVKYDFALTRAGIRKTFHRGKK